MRGAAERDRVEHHGRAWLAWNTAYLPHMKKPPKFEDLLGRAEPRDDRDRVARFHAAWDDLDQALRGR